MIRILVNVEPSSGFLIHESVPKIARSGGGRGGHDRQEWQAALKSSKGKEIVWKLS